MPRKDKKERRPPPHHLQHQIPPHHFLRERLEHDHQVHVHQKMDMERMKRHIGPVINKRDEKPLQRPPLRRFKDSIATTLSPETLTEMEIKWGNYFSVEASKGDAIAVQIVRHANTYTAEDGHYPRLSVCRWESRSCTNDEDGKSLSFEADADTVAKVLRKTNTFDFSVSSFNSQMIGVIVDMYVCVGPNASLATCRTPVTVECEHGQPSDVLDVCICEDGYNGNTCNMVAPTAPEEWDYESQVHEFASMVAHIICFFLNFVFFVGLILLIFSCICIRACLRSRANRGRVVNRAPAVAAAVPPRAMPIPPPPPPPYYANAYRPLSAVPPPPPPPPPMSQPPRRNPYEGVEMSVLPPRPATTVVVMPPLAPVKQVPVYIRPPPAPKN